MHQTVVYVIWTISCLWRIASWPGFNHGSVNKLLLFRFTYAHGDSLCTGMVENILQQIDGSFQKQSASVQEMLRMRWLRVRLALCNIIPSGRQRSAECHALLVLSSISLILQSLLRPVTITTLDKVIAALCVGCILISTAMLICSWPDLAYDGKPMVFCIWQCWFVVQRHMLCVFLVWFV